MDEDDDFDPRAGGVKGRNGPKWITRLIRKDPFDREDDYNSSDIQSGEE